MLAMLRVLTIATVSLVIWPFLSWQVQIPFASAARRMACLILLLATNHLGRAARFTPVEKPSEERAFQGAKCRQTRFRDTVFITVRRTEFPGTSISPFHDQRPRPALPKSAPVAAKAAVSNHNLNPRLWQQGRCGASHGDRGFS